MHVWLGLVCWVHVSELHVIMVSPSQLSRLYRVQVEPRLDKEGKCLYVLPLGEASLSWDPKDLKGRAEMRVGKGKEEKKVTLANKANRVGTAETVLMGRQGLVGRGVVSAKHVPKVRQVVMVPVAPAAKTGKLV